VILADDKRKELQKLLDVLEGQKELERSGQRERLIEKNRSVYRFREIKKTVILPALRQCMADLESKGHFTRLRQPSADKVRLDVQIHAAAAKRGAVEIALHASEPDKVRVDYGWGWKVEHEVYALDQVEGAFVTDRVLYLVKGLLG
jgi:hypothetical protein